MKKFCSMLVLGAFGINGVYAQQALSLDPAVRTGKLKNGFTYYIRHNEEPKDRVVMYLVNKVGSVLEDEDQRGLAHFMEHMSFNGTTHFPKNELINYLQKSGVRFGADINAYTSFDETVYQLPIPSDNPELLAAGIRIMRDWAGEATLDPVEINKERGVVLEEKRLGKGAKERMQRQYWPVLMNHSRYAERLPIGIDTVLNNFKPETIRRFYKNWYRPDLQALIIVGDINVNAMEEIIKNKFADLTNPPHEKPRPEYKIPLTGKNQFVAVTDKEMTATVAEVLIQHSELPERTAADYRKNMIRSLFNQMLGDRYNELSLLADPPFVQGGADISGFAGGLDSYGASVVAKPGEMEKGFKAMWRETERVKRFGFTPTELQRAKTAYLNSMESALKEQDKTASENYVREYQQYFLKEIASPGIKVEYEMTKSDLPGISLREVNSLAAQYITRTNMDILVLAPDKDRGTLPTEAIVNGWMKAVAAEKLQPYKDETSTLPLLEKQPVAGTVETEEFNKALDLLTLKLSNGTTVVLKPTNFKNNEILFSAFQSGGTSLYSDADFQSAANAGIVIPANGAGNYGRAQLDKFLEGKEVQVTPYINERFAGISGGSTPKDLETALEMIYAYFTGPRKDTAIFSGIMKRSKAGLANRASDPASVFNDSVSAILGNYNIRRTGPSVEKLEAVNLDRAYAIYKERFADASGFTFVFTGNFDTLAIRPLLEKYLGSLPFTGSHESAHDLGIHAPEGQIEKNVYKGSEPKANVELFFTGRFDYSQENKIKLDALKEVLEIRLLERLREDESGVYSPGVFVNTTKYPQSRFSFVIQFGCAPQNVDKLVASALDEINKLRTDGPPQENVDKWRAEDKVSRETKLKTNDWWLSYLTGQLQNQDDLNQLNGYADDREKVTPASIKEAANAYLDGKNYIKMVLLPETKK